MPFLALIVSRTLYSDVCRHFHLLSLAVYLPASKKVLCNWKEAHHFSRGAKASPSELVTAASMSWLRYVAKLKNWQKLSMTLPENIYNRMCYRRKHQREAEVTTAATEGSKGTLGKKAVKCPGGGGKAGMYQNSTWVEAAFRGPTLEEDLLALRVPLLWGHDER